VRDAAGLSYVASDHLGTPLATLNLDTGAVLGEQLRAPYGQPRYAASAPTNGGMRTTHGLTGQREDAMAAGSSGLDYFNARHYDPAVGWFTSADPYVISVPPRSSTFVDLLGPPVKASGRADGHALGLEGGAAGELGVLQRLNAGKMLGDQRLVGERPAEPGDARRAAARENRAARTTGERVRAPAA